ncbi:hypothetical protein PTSG_08851 [Salpingoeca rosetta]|uniref:ubiquitinyl hydrolase 1 n=1 Tax=Salpingoeca rosetta (strain ATCC 50818 / BSB-021) TaxID=946362 RepID=F2UKW3_SALR5|nr:uncharacterized protein PTSG_08851 [Salpingoeca rosetta]EGD77762.1 hypothetical protein PTSG_08851 [Salpingoeca rosetta]|eukprot:XP_004990238.1 hypothetical protein PTSG_08851 [Salpingoeca rosetta]
MGKNRNKFKHNKHNKHNKHHGPKRDVTAMIDANIRAHDNVWNKRIQFEPAQDLKAATGGLTGTLSVKRPENGSAGASHVHLRDKDGFVEAKRQLFNQNTLRVTWKKPRPMGAGLGNLGNTCFLNATLQCLAYTPALANFCLSGQYQRTHTPQPGFDAMKLVELHVHRSLTSPKRTVLPKGIINHLRQINKAFRHYQQQDAHEFFICLLDAMQTALLGDYKNLDLRVQETTVLHHIFGGYLRSQIQCVRCKHCSNTFESFFDLSIDIKAANSLTRALQQFVTKELLFKTNSYSCSGCKNKVPATKQLTIHRLPNVLCIQLKRFSFMSHFGSKLRHKVSYPMQLNVHEFLSRSIRSRISRGACRYELYGVLVHLGATLSSGHYIAYVRAANGMWYCADDDDVRFSKENEVLNQAAYMLFYTRTDNKPPPTAYCPQPKAEVPAKAAAKQKASPADTNQQQQQQQQITKQGQADASKDKPAQAAAMQGVEQQQQQQQQKKKKAEKPAAGSASSLMDGVAAAVASSDSESEEDGSSSSSSSEEEDVGEELPFAPPQRAVPNGGIARSDSTSSTSSSEGFMDRNPTYDPVITTTDERCMWTVQLNPPRPWRPAYRRERWDRYATISGWRVTNDDDDVDDEGRGGDDNDGELPSKRAKAMVELQQLQAQGGSLDSEDDSDDEEFVPSRRSRMATGADDDDDDDDEDAIGAVSMEELESLFKEQADHARQEREHAGVAEDGEGKTKVEKKQAKQAVVAPVATAATAASSDNDDGGEGDVSLPIGSGDIEDHHRAVLDNTVIDILQRVSKDVRARVLACVNAELYHHLTQATAAVLEALSEDERAALTSSNGGDDDDDDDEFLLELEELPVQLHRSIAAAVSNNVYKMLEELYGSDGAEEDDDEKQGAGSSDEEEEGDGDGASSSGEEGDVAAPDGGHAPGPMQMNGAAAHRSYAADSDSEDDDAANISFEDDDEEEDEMHRGEGASDSDSNSDSDSDSEGSDADEAGATTAAQQDVDVVAWNVDRGTTEQIVKSKKKALWDGKRRTAVDPKQADASEAVTTWDDTHSSALAPLPKPHKSKEERDREAFDEEMDRGRVKKVRGPKQAPTDLKSKFNAMVVAQKEGKAVVPDKKRQKKRHIKQMKKRNHNRRLASGSHARTPQHEN